MDLKGLLTSLGTSAESGLTRERAEQLLAEVGPNTLKGKKHLNFFQKFLLQLMDFMVIILLIAAAISFVMAVIEGHGDFLEPIIIVAIVVLNGVLGVVQESNAEKALDALKSMSAPTAKVVRGGTVVKIDAALLVPGDIVLLEAGDLIPADARLVESASLKCEESALTGESVPVDKDALALVPETAAIGDRLNMVYMGTAASYGRARAVVTGTGMRTEMGKIAGLLEGAGSETTPLQEKLTKLGKQLGILAIGVCVIIFAVGLLRGQPLMEMFMTAISLAVAAIPEGLTAVVTIVLALGVQRMVKHNAIVRRLPAVETLGSASVICSDKTGTLTQNRMTVQKVWAVGSDVCDAGYLSQDALTVIRMGTLCNDGRIVPSEGKDKHIGDPTETSIVANARLNGVDKETLDARYPRVAEIPFDSDRKLMTTVHEMDGRLVAVVKGGFDVLLPRCVEADENEAARVNLLMANDALRVLGVAVRELEALPDPLTSETLEIGLTFIGLIGMIDPPREESKDAVATCVKAGIRTVMITGDHVVTASAIASRIGILREGDESMSGSELQALSQEDLEKNVHRYSVYARVSPEDKIRIVRAWQARGQVVSMTGDGVNDAPALKAADIGCAMGITGTDVAKGAADMVLTDDNFATIVEAVRQGRGIYDNIKKTVEFLLGSNLGEVLVVFTAMLIGWGNPLMAIHLLLINVVTDAFPALALGEEPIDSRIMTRKPIPRDEGIFAGHLAVKIGLQGLMIAVLTLAGYYIGSFVSIGGSVPSHALGQTMAFLTLSLSQLIHAFNCRTHQSLFTIGIFSNRRMLQAFGVSLLVVLLVALIPPVAAAFELVALPAMCWATVITLSALPLPILEIYKGVSHGANDLSTSKG